MFQSREHNGTCAYCFHVHYTLLTVIFQDDAATTCSSEQSDGVLMFMTMSSTTAPQDFHHPLSRQHRNYMFRMMEPPYQGTRS